MRRCHVWGTAGGWTEGFSTPQLCRLDELTTLRLCKRCGYRCWWNKFDMMLSFQWHWHVLSS